MSTLPNELVQKIHDACKMQGLDHKLTTEAINQMVADDTCVDYWVWSGPAPGQGDADLKLDIYVLGGWCLYNYAVKQNSIQATSLFLEGIAAVALVDVVDDRCQYILVFQAGTSVSIGRLYVKKEDLDQCRRFRRSLIQACLRAKGVKGGN